MSVNAAFFYLFATITIASGVMVIASRNPVQSVLFLILAFVNAAGLFVMMGAEFLAMILSYVLDPNLIRTPVPAAAPALVPTVPGATPAVPVLTNTEAMGQVLY